MAPRHRRLLLAALAALALAFAAIPAGAASAPSLSAQAATLIEADTGTVIYSRNSNERRPMASTTKMMTALVALQHASPGRVLTVQPYAAAPGETVAGLSPGQRLTVYDLLEAMLLPSGGDAAHTLAVDLGGSVDRFVGWMNAEAGRLHLTETHYATPVGLDTPGHYSSARDLARLAVDLLANSVLARVVTKPSARLSDGQVVVNRNNLVGTYPYAIGVKTGNTAGAGQCLVGAARRAGVTVVSVVMGEPSIPVRDADSLALLRYGLSLYHSAQPVLAGHVYARIPIMGRAPARVQVVAARTVSLILHTGTRLQVYLTHVPTGLLGPLRARARAGEVNVRENGRLVARVPLVTARAVPAPLAPLAPVGPIGPTGPTGPSGPTGPA